AKAGAHPEAFETPPNRPRPSPGWCRVLDGGAERRTGAAFFQLAALDLDVDLECRGVAGAAERHAKTVVADLDIAADDGEQFFLQDRQEIGGAAAGALVREHDLEAFLGDRSAGGLRPEQ